MTQIRTASIGSYPRIGEEKDQQRHRRAMTHFQNKQISAHALRDVEQSVIQEVIREQIAAGLDEVTDGLISWQDPISHFCQSLGGVKITGLTRYFDTNFYYRIPEIVGKPRVREPVLASGFEFAKGVSSRPVRAVLTGPYTLASHTFSVIKPYHKLPARLSFFTEVIAREAAALAAQGALLIQLDEPSLLYHPEDLPLFREALIKIAGTVKETRLILALYFGSPAAVYPEIKDLPVYSLNLDFTYDGKRLVEKILESPPGPALGFGLVNARSTKMEAVEPLLKMLRSWIEKTHAAVGYLTPSSGLEHLPREAALAKLKLLAKIREECLAAASDQSVRA